MRSHRSVAAVTASADEIPTDAPEARGTLHRTSTTLIVVEVEAGGKAVDAALWDPDRVLGAIRQLIAGETS